MQKNLLEQLKKYTTIVADTGDLKAIERLKPLDATTNPSLITKALNSSEQESLIKQRLQKNSGDIEKTIDDLTTIIGKQILDLIEGRVSTEIDANFAFDSKKTLENAKKYIEIYEKYGVDKKRILIKIPATWQGIRAAEELEKQNIHCNLTLIFDLFQAQACADAGVTLISPFVGRILDWQKNHQKRQSIKIEEDLGVKSVKQIYNYYKQHSYKTQIMGASFRSVEQICALAGCDFLTISPDLLDELKNTTGALVPSLKPNMKFEKMDLQKLNESKYLSKEKESEFAKELLLQGIKGFVNAKKQLAENLIKLA